MKKQTIAYILIAAGVIAALYYFFKKNQSNAAANALGAGAPDERGVWAADDDATYKSMRNVIANYKDGYDGNTALGWIDPGVEANYLAGPGFHNIKGKASKAGALLSVFEAVNPNPAGVFVEEGVKVLFPHSVHDDLWRQFNALKVKYGGL